MTVLAYQVADLRFVGTRDQWDAFHAANGAPLFSFCGTATEDERARWRKDRGVWFVVPTAEFDRDAVGQLDTDGDLVRAEESTCFRSVSIVRNPESSKPEVLAVLDPDAAEALARQIARMAKVARAQRVKMDARDAVDESLWEEVP